MKKVLLLFLTLFLSGVFVITIISFNTGVKEYVNKNNCSIFGIPRILTIGSKMNSRDKDVAISVIQTAINVFEYTGSYEESNKNVGALSKYYEYDCNYATVSIDILTAKVFGNRGYIWVNYSESHIKIDDSENKQISGSSDVLSFWKIKKTNNMWTVVKIIEAP